MSPEPNQQQAQQQPRGAGSGAIATATRSRNLVDWPPPPKSHEEHVDELEAERDAQADYNNEMNKIQTEQIARATQAAREAAMPDPAEAREEAKKAYIASTDPKVKEANIKGAKAAQEKAAKEAAAK